MNGREGEEAEDAGYGESSRYAAHLDRGWALLDRGDLAAARTSVQHAQDVRPEDPDAAVLLGAIALAEGNAQDSLRCYERAMEMDGDYLEPYAAAAAVCLYELDDPIRALRYVGDALELEELAPFELVDLHMLAAECELASDDVQSARSRIAGLAEVGVIEHALELASTAGDPAAMLEDEDVERAAAAEFLALDPEGEPLEDEERVDRVARVVGYALRLARLRLDTDLIDPARAILAKVVEGFPREADAHHLLSEAEYRAGDIQRACIAGVRTLELDAEWPMPEWMPSPAVIHRRVLQMVAACGEPRIRALAERDPPIGVLVREQPAPELVLEGVDPRTGVLSCASRPPEGKPGAAMLTGLAVYRRNLARVCRDGDSFLDELREALLDELAAFFGLSARARAQLAIAAAAAAIEPPPEPEPPDPSVAPKRRRAARRVKPAS
ncbi:MAG TPA: metallopeptidase family protein [Nannocystaceae bacterium]|nr:metallopeptidase family protein [Nannocystaceae bacterium]